MDSVLISSSHFPCATEQSFASFNNKYAGQSCHVIGRGPTEFDYRRLASLDEPIFFINDAVCMEKHVRSETFFFAHDPQTLGWLDGSIRSTAVLPMNGKLFRGQAGLKLNHAGKVVFYQWVEHKPAKEALLHMTREELALARGLFTHTGTIHSLLHFVWFCGFKRVSFVGCDGITDIRPLLASGIAAGYDPRLENRSRSVPSTTYPSITKAQQLLTMLFGLEAVYLGTPGGTTCSHCPEPSAPSP